MQGGSERPGGRRAHEAETGGAGAGASLEAHGMCNHSEPTNMAT